MFLVENQMFYITLNLSYYILLSYIAYNFLYLEWEKIDKDPLAVEKAITCPKF